MSYSNFQNLEDFKVYLKKVVVEDIGKALEEIEEIVIVNSSAFDACLIYQTRYNQFTKSSDEEKYDERIQVEFSKLINSIFGLINSLKFRHLKGNVTKHFSNTLDVNNKEKSFQFLIKKIEYLLYKDIDAFFDYMKDKLSRSKVNDLILLKMQKKILDRDWHLGLITKKAKEDSWDEIFKKLLSFIDNLTQSDFKKDIFKNK